MRAPWLGVLATVAIFDIACMSTRQDDKPPANVASQPPAPTPNGDDGDVSDEDVSGPLPTLPPGTRGNTRIHRFDEAKKELARIYDVDGRRVDLYCGCSFLHFRVDLASCGYVPARDRARAERIEWEHAVPAAAFGHTFVEWREGSPRCVDRRGKAYRGRKCARIASPEFARIEADLHNLFPVVGEVNGLRGDLPMGVLDGRSGGYDKGGGPTFRFGACTSAIERGVFLPRREVRGDLARAYKYMARSYPERNLIDDAHRALFDTWDREDPPDAWEKERNRLIAARQGNANETIGE